MTQTLITRIHPLLIRTSFTLNISGMKIHSNIIQDNEFFLSHLSRFMEPLTALNSHWNLCYRASAYGWAASTFHSYCDGKRHTITIIKKDQFVFGGYVDIPWGMNSI